MISSVLDIEPEWNDMEFFIKWKGQSHLHCEWKSYSDLQNVSLGNAKGQYNGFLESCYFSLQEKIFIMLACYQCTVIKDFVF